MAMATEIKSELSANEIIFMQRMDAEIFPNRNHVSMPLLKEVAGLVGIPVDASCRSCATKGGNDMVNRYGQLKPKYDEYIKNKPEPEIYTKYEAVVQDEVDSFTIDEPTPVFDANGDLEKPKKKPIKNAS